MHYSSFISRATSIVLGALLLGSNLIYADITQPAALTTTDAIALFQEGGTISNNGRYVVFKSSDPNVVPNDTNGMPDIFVRDLEKSTTQRVNIGNDGSQSNEVHAFYLAAVAPISENGRFIAFTSSADNMVINDDNDLRDVFLRDMENNTTELISQSTSGEIGNGVSFVKSISSDGRFVAFMSYASNLVIDDTNGYADTFVRDRELQQTYRVSIASDGTEGNYVSSGESRISDNGRFVAFESRANNLVPGDTNDYSQMDNDIFVHDRETGLTERVNVSSSGAQATDNCNLNDLSGNGRYILFNCSMTGTLVPDEPSGTYTYLHDREKHTTKIIGYDYNGEPVNVMGRSLSEDGRYVLFTSAVSTLVPLDMNEQSDVFRFDRETGVTEIVSLQNDGSQTTISYIMSPQITNDGKASLFHAYTGGGLQVRDMQTSGCSN